MKRQQRLWLTLGLGAALQGGNALAQTFEQVGVVQDVIVEKNIVVVDGTRYKLPNSLQENGSPVLFQLKQGQVVNFSGTVEKPESVIESLTINRGAPAPLEQTPDNATVPQL